MKTNNDFYWTGVEFHTIEIILIINIVIIIIIIKKYLQKNGQPNDVTV